jgi:hypothetical protein
MRKKPQPEIPNQIIDKLLIWVEREYEFNISIVNDLPPPKKTFHDRQPMDPGNAWSRQHFHSLLQNTTN